MLFDIFSSRAGRGNQAEADWTDQQSSPSYCKAILDVVKGNVCSLVYNFAVCLNDGHLWAIHLRSAGSDYDEDTS